MKIFPFLAALIKMWPYFAAFFYTNSLLITLGATVFSYKDHSQVQKKKKNHLELVGECFWNVQDFMPTPRLLPFRPLVCHENETPPQFCPVPKHFPERILLASPLDITSLYSLFELRCRLWLQIPTGGFSLFLLTNKSGSARPRNSFPSPCSHHVRSLERSFGWCSTT